MSLGPAAPLSVSAGYPYRHGPWAIAWGRGSNSERCARALRAECDRRGFDGPSLPTEETARLHLDRYPSMIVIAPSEGLDGNTVALLRPSDDLAGGYRARRPDGLVAVQQGHVKAYDAGVLQVVMAEDLLDHTAARRLRDRACGIHELDKLTRTPGEIFSIYESAIPGRVSPAPGLAEPELLRLWNQVRRWGLQTIEDVHPVLARLDALRDHYNFDARPGLRRPLGDAVPRSRYDFVLDEPHDYPNRLGQSSTWKADGAEVIRKVIQSVKEVLPTFVNPQPSRGSTDRFGRFYGDLKSLQLYLDNTPETDQVRFPHE